MQEMRIQVLGGEGALEKEMVTTGNHLFGLSLYESASFLLHSLVCCVTDIPHIRDISQYLSFSDLFH